MRYNAAQKRTRRIIERIFGRLKRQFPCLNYLRLKLDNVFAVIVACSVLWNISIQRRDPEIHGPACDEIPGDIRPHPRCVREVKEEWLWDRNAILELKTVNYAEYGVDVFARAIGKETTIVYKQIIVDDL